MLLLAIILACSRTPSPQPRSSASRDDAIQPRQIYPGTVGVVGLTANDVKTSIKSFDTSHRPCPDGRKCEVGWTISPEFPANASPAVVAAYDLEPLGPNETSPARPTEAQTVVTCIRAEGPVGTTNPITPPNDYTTTNTACVPGQLVERVEQPDVELVGWRHRRQVGTRSIGDRTACVVWSSWIVGPSYQLVREDVPGSAQNLEPAHQSGSFIGIPSSWQDFKNKALSAEMDDAPYDGDIDCGAAGCKMFQEVQYRFLDNAAAATSDAQICAATTEGS